MIFLKFFNRHKSIFNAILAVLVLIAVIPWLANLLPIIRFSEEAIDIRVLPDEIRVRGAYAFRNPFPFSLNQTFSYTLPEDVDLSEPLDLKARKIFPDKAPLSFTDTLASRRFELRFAPRETVSIEIEYRQKTPKHYARYIPITMNHRNRPLQYGSYALIPEGVEIVSSSYPLRPGDSGIRYNERHQFIHTGQWRFSWRVEDNDALLTRHEDSQIRRSDLDAKEKPSPLATFRLP